jgi:hypothetical protein
VEIEKLISALEEILVLLWNSRSSDYTHMSVDEIIEKLEFELTRVKMSEPLNAILLSFLFAPTGAIQDTAIDNGWGEEFLRISEIVDQFTSDK